MRSRRLRLAGLASIVAVSALATGVWSPHGADAQTDRAQAVEDPLESITLESGAYRDAVERLERAEHTIAQATTRIGQIERELEQLRSAERQLADGIPSLEARIVAADAAVDVAREELADLAVLQYVVHAGDPGLRALTTPASDLHDSQRRDLVIETAAAGHRAALATSAQRLEDAVAAVAVAEESTVTVAERIDALTVELAHTIELRDTTTAALPELDATVERERKLSRVTGSDLTVVALQAYVSAALAMEAEQPDCRMSWELLAGIGRVESRHGTYRGSKVGPNGDVSPRIIGIALDGSHQTAVITDSDGGALDGDTVFDRAVGPMQFIPTTWAAFAADGNRDGISDPQNIFDAALAAARYLCRRGPLDTDANQVGAILTYNNSRVYVTAVQGHARRYAELEITP